MHPQILIKFEPFFDNIYWFYSENAQIYTVAGVGSAGESMYMEKINVGTGDAMRQVFKFTFSDWLA